MHRKSKSGGGVTRCVPNGIVLWRLLVKIGPADWQLGIEPCSLSAVLRSWGHPEPTFFLLELEPSPDPAPTPNSP